MINKPVLEDHYNEMVWTNLTTDIIRRQECLCLHCNNMTYDKETNCSIAQQLYELCCEENIAFMMTRCKKYNSKS